MKSLLQVIGAFLVIASVLVITRFVMNNPNVDLLEPSSGGRLMGMLIPGILGIGLVIHGFKKKTDESDGSNEPEAD